MDRGNCFEDLGGWNTSSLNASALHTLAQQCPYIAPLNSTFVQHLYSPSTFFLQLVRLSVSLCIVTILLTLYNYVRVLEQPIISTATCSIYWIVFFSLAALKSGLLVILVPVNARDDLRINTELSGFIVTTIIQLATSFVLYLALHHEVQYRSSEYATIDSPPRRLCISLRGLKRMCSWHRVIVLVMTLVPLLYLVAIELAFRFTSDVLPTAVVWPFILLLPLPRFAAVGVVIYMMLRRNNKPLLQPTVLAKVFLCVATVLSLMEDIPNSVTTIAPEHSNCTCPLEVMSTYDLLQLIGLIAFLFYAMFVRSQYLRVEQESKLSLVEGLQRLLQVNGRKDVISRDYTSTSAT